MKILITGGTGYVGCTLVPYLLEKGIEDICLIVRSKEKVNQLFYGLPIRIIDVNNMYFKEQIIAFDPDIVLHMATLFNTRHDSESILKIIDANITFSSLLLEAIAATRCKYFVNVGTFTEFLLGNGEYLPNNFYSATKTAFRSIIRYFQLISSFKWINIIIYSPYGRINKQKKVIDYLIDSLDAPSPVKMTKGEQILDFIHLDDIVDFFYTLFTRIEVCSERYIQLHLGTGQGHSIREVAGIVEYVFGKKLNVNWGALPYRQMDTMYAVAPIAGTIDLINWRATLSLEEGIEILKNDLRL